jgi:hypothetical protein
VVSEAVRISRSQAARYIRKARSLGLIPPVGEVTGRPGEQRVRELLQEIPTAPGYGPIPFTSFPSGLEGEQAGGHR